GIYTGKVTATFSDGTIQEAQVALIVSPPGPKSFPVSGNCVPHGMELEALTVGTGENFMVSFPRRLLAQVLDTCGQPVNDATVLVDVEDSAIVLQSIGNGLYSGFWTPAQDGASIPVKFTALQPSYGSVQRSFTV